MTETTTQAVHELLKGLNQDTKILMRTVDYMSAQLTTISQQLLDQIRAAGGPALGLCGSHVAEWVAAGADPDAVLPAAQTMFVAEGTGAVPMCLEHFRELMQSLRGSRLVPAQPGMVPPSGGLPMPGQS